MPCSIPAVSTSQSPLWSWRLALVLGLLPLLAAIGFLLFPTTSTTHWGFPPPTTPTHRSYLTLLATRDLYISLTAALLWWAGEVRALGWVLVVVGVVPAVDGVVAWQNGATWLQIVQHWGLIPVYAAIGYLLINARR